MTNKNILFTAIFLISYLLSFAQDEIAFISNRNNDPDAWLIYKMDAEGKNQRQLLDDIVTCGPILGTPTGDKIAFILVKQGLHTINKDGSNLKRISKTGESPTWSYDGQKLLYVERDGKESDIYLYDFAIGKRIKITNDGHSHSPSWFPDNNKFAFYSESNDTCGIKTMTIDGKNKKHISPPEQCYYNPQVSPKGDKIAFVSLDWKKGPQLFVTDTSGNNFIQLTRSFNIRHRDPGFSVEGNCDPVWSPDGSKIAYVTWEDGNPDICTITADGQDKQKLTKDTSRDEDPSWSYDGKYIIYSSALHQIFRMKADGTEKTNLSNYRGDHGQPIWIKN